MTSIQEAEPGILFVIPTLEPGGAERACLNYVNNLRRYRRVLVLLAGQGLLVNELARDVPVFDLSFENYRLGRGLLLHYSSPVKQARSLAKLAHRTGCTTTCSFLTEANLVAIIAKTLFDHRLKVVINVHDVTTHILAHSKLKSHQRFLLRSLLRFLYPRADSVVAVADGVRSDLVQHFGIPAEKVAAIHNPIDVDHVRMQAAELVTHPWINRKEGLLLVAVGRLVKLKGFDLLIQAFARLPHALGPRLIILGEGTERPRLEQLISQLGLQERVALLGFQDNPWKYMARADIFVLSSLIEGLPNVVGEAMTLGLPVLATDCPGGIREYVQDGQSGVLVPPADVNALAQGLERLLSDGRLQQRLAQGACEQATTFNLPNVIQAYEAALARLIGG